MKKIILKILLKVIDVILLALNSVNLTKEDMEEEDRRRGKRIMD